MKKSIVTACVFACVGAMPLVAQEINLDAVRQISTHIGEMRANLQNSDTSRPETIVFEPYQLAEDMFSRGDLVYLMRHGPTDWSKRDANNVAPTDCANQRVMTDEGAEQMAELGEILAGNGVIPAQIVVSEWCRNQQTYRSIIEGFSRVDPTLLAGLQTEVDPEVNLLLSLQGAPSVELLRERISRWDGDPERPGPLLIISHYTNIEELTQFRVFEGEALVIDPKLDNRVIGYFRLNSAGPDEGHFADALESPLLDGNEAFQMVERFYSAVGNKDLGELDALLSDGWVSRGLSEGGGDQDVVDFLTEVQNVSGGLSGARFAVQDVYTDDDVVTVIGEVSGIHDGEIFGIPGTGRPVSFGAIAVHRVVDGQISETWQIADRVALIQQLSE
ncbi:MAG: ester cyclase [Pseudomonadota bacterium]